MKILKAKVKRRLNKKAIQKAIIDAMGKRMDLYKIITLPTQQWKTFIPDPNTLLFTDKTGDIPTHYIQGYKWTETFVSQDRFENFTFEVFDTLAK